MNTNAEGGGFDPSQQGIRQAQQESNSNVLKTNE